MRYPAGHFAAAVVLALIAASCAPTTVRPPAVDPDTIRSPVEAAAARSLAAYGAGLADAAEQTANAIEAGSLTSAAAVFDAAAAANKSAREAAFAPFAAALDTAVPPAGEFDGTATAKAFRDAAKGFRGAAK